MWKAHDTNNDGVLSDKEVDVFKAIMATVDTNKDGKVSREEFMSACQKGIMKDIKK